MRRYQGEELRPAPRIAVVANDAIGNFVVGTPLLQMLRERFQPAALDYYGGTRTWELIEASDLIDFAFPLHGAPPCKTAEAISERTQDGVYDLVVNMEWTAYAKVCAGMLAGTETFVVGPSIGLGGRCDLPFASDQRGDLWRDQEWISANITKRYPFLDSGFIGEIFCRLTYLDGQVPRYSLPTKPVAEAPDVLIATAASLPEKLWTLEKWREALKWIAGKGWSVGLIGAPPASQKQYWQGDATEDLLVEEGLVHDLRGKFTLPEVVGALSSTKRVLTIDNGVLHLACGANTPTVGLFRYGVHRLWAPPYEKLTVLHPEEGISVAEVELCSVIEAIESCE